MSAPLTYGPPYMPGAGRGFDDVVFDGNRIFLSETNPAVIGDPVIVQLVNPFSTLQTTPILSFGDTGTDLNTGQKTSRYRLPILTA